MLCYFSGQAQLVLPRGCYSLLIRFLRESIVLTSRECTSYNDYERIFNQYYNAMDPVRYDSNFKFGLPDVAEKLSASISTGHI